MLRWGMGQSGYFEHFMVYHWCIPQNRHRNSIFASVGHGLWPFQFLPEHQWCGTVLRDRPPLPVDRILGDTSMGLSFRKFNFQQSAVSLGVLDRPWVWLHVTVAFKVFRWRSAQWAQNRQQWQGAANDSWMMVGARWSPKKWFLLDVRRCIIFLDVDVFSFLSTGTCPESSMIRCFQITPANVSFHSISCQIWEHPNRLSLTIRRVNRLLNTMIVLFTWEKRQHMICSLQQTSRNGGKSLGKPWQFSELGLDHSLQNDVSE